jgi:hypothetical protein
VALAAAAAGTETPSIRVAGPARVRAAMAMVVAVETAQEGVAMAVMPLSLLRRAAKAMERLLTQPAPQNQPVAEARAPASAATEAAAAAAQANPPRAQRPPRSSRADIGAACKYWPSSSGVASVGRTKDICSPIMTEARTQQPVKGK